MNISFKQILFLLALTLIILHSCKKKNVLNTNPIVENPIIEKPIINQPVNPDSVLDPEVTKYYNPYFNLGKLTLKGSMHVHTDNSLPIDGYKSGDPKWVAEKLRDEGNYDFFAITDHNYITEDPKVGGIVWMGYAIEDTSPNVHVTAYNLPNKVYVPTKNDISDKVDYYKSIGAYTNLCHPNWPRTIITESMISNASTPNFVEVMSPNLGEENHRILDLIRYQNKIIFGFGVDDFHYNASWKDPNTYFNKAWIVVFTDVKEKNAIWEALLKGSFYVSNGPSIDVNFRDDQLKVYTDLTSEITFMGGTKDGKTVKLEVVKNVLMASYTFTSQLNWLRAEVKNAKGLAYTQAIQLKK